MRRSEALAGNGREGPNVREADQADHLSPACQSILPRSLQPRLCTLSFETELCQDKRTSMTIGSTFIFPPLFRGKPPVEAGELYGSSDSVNDK